MSMQKTFAQRIGLYWTCVILADAFSAEPVLSDDETEEQDTSSLYAEASTDGYSFAQVSRSFHDGTYLAHVAASPEQVSTGFTIILSEEDLYCALPYDTRLKATSGEVMRLLLRAQAAKVRPLVRVVPPLTEYRHERPDVFLPPSALRDLEEAVFVEDADLPSSLAPVIDSQLLDAALREYGTRSDASSLSCALRHHLRKLTSHFHVQQLFLQAALDTVMRQLYGCEEPTRVQKLKARCLHIAHLKRWHHASRQRVIEAVPIYDLYQRCTTWRLEVSFPTGTRKTERVSPAA